MKKTFTQQLFALAIVSLSTIALALGQETERADSTSASGKTIKKSYDLDFSFGKEDHNSSKEIKKEKDKIVYPRTFGGLTFTRIDWGFSRIIDDGSFNLTGDNEFLDYGRASNFGFDIAQFGVRFSDATKVYLSTGFEWNYLRLKKNIILDTDATPLAYEMSTDNFKKNILTSTYLRVPLTFEFRGKQNRNGDRMKVAVGAMTGILLKGSQRIKLDKGKHKYKDDFNLASFQYGGFVRVGYGPMGVFAKYYMNDFFEKSPAQKGLNNFTFGLTLGF